jgi:D-beta-D-heptose 7-phosphate kinase / D-beta-D-heptose 1-phosphate adenosyltransferase
MQIKKAKELLKTIKRIRPKILVIGDVMLDEYIHGIVERISPEAPVPILNFSKKEKILGGAGNVVSNLVNLGAKTDLATIIGDDQEGRELNLLLQKNNISCELIISSKNVNTTKKTRFLCDSKQLFRLDKDSNGFSENDYIRIEKKINSVLKKYDCIILSDYNKGVFSDSFTKNIIKYGNTLKIPVYIDPKGDNWNKYYGATVITPNITEVENELKIKLRTDSDFEKAALKIKENFNLGSCLITRGSSGMTFLNDKTIIHQKVGKKEVFDVSGAGDTAISSLSAGLCSGINLSEVLSLSSFISSEVVSHIGTTPFKLEMLNDE